QLSSGTEVIFRRIVERHRDGSRRARPLKIRYQRGNGLRQTSERVGAQVVAPFGAIDNSVEHEDGRHRRRRSETTSPIRAPRLPSKPESKSMAMATTLTDDVYRWVLAATS